MYNRKDSYYKKAKDEGYKSRAAYKLIELNKKYNIIRSGNRVLDCGAAPGGWSQVALKLTGPAGLVAAVDLEAITGINDKNFIFFQGDMTSAEMFDKVSQVAPGGYEAIISDMAPKTTGIRVRDHLGSAELVEKVMSLCPALLKQGGSMLVKLFDGEEREGIVKNMRGMFNQVKLIRPDATRKSSFEMYIICTGYKR